MIRHCTCKTNYNIPIMVVSRVSDLAERAIRLKQRVFSFHDVSVTHLVLGLVVTGVGVFNGVRVLIFGVSLEQRQLKIII